MAALAGGPPKKPVTVPATEEAANENVPDPKAATDANGETAPVASTKVAAGPHPDSKGDAEETPSQEAFTPGASMRGFTVGAPVIIRASGLRGVVAAVSPKGWIKVDLVPVEVDEKKKDEKEDKKKKKDKKRKREEDKNYRPKELQLVEEGRTGEFDDADATAALASATGFQSFDDFDPNAARKTDLQVAANVKLAVENFEAIESEGHAEAPSKKSRAVEAQGGKEEAATSSTTRKDIASAISRFAVNAFRLPFGGSGSSGREEPPASAPPAAPVSAPPPEPAPVAPKASSMPTEPAPSEPAPPAPQEPVPAKDLSPKDVEPVASNSPPQWPVANPTIGPQLPQAAAGGS